MIKINNKTYEQGEFDIEWGKFTKVTSSRKKTGIAPRIYFYIDKGESEGEYEKEIMLELTFTKGEFEDMKIGVEEDLHKEVIDIGYSDVDDGWLTLNNSDFTCTLTRITENKYSINFNCHDPFEEIDIWIDEILTIN